MKFICTIFFFVLSSAISHAQLDKKLKKLIVNEVVLLEVKNESVVGDEANWKKYTASSYPWAPEGAIFYPSETYRGDTTGASNDGEFLMFRDDIASRKGEAFKLFRLSWVSNWEYKQFIKWVRDSTIMEFVYFNTDPTGNNSIEDELIGEMLNHPESYYDSVNMEHTYFDPSQPFINRQLFNFSWSMKGIRDSEIIPLISDLYLRPHERFKQNKDWDERKLWYAIDGDRENRVMIAPDRDVWAQQSEYPFDFYYNMANYYSLEDPSGYDPVIGLLGTQIMAFLNFKERMIQKELDDNGYGYSVHLSLPTEDEIKKADTADCDCKMAYLMKEKDMTEHWKITNENYWDFLSWVQDSILREAIYLNPKPKGGKEIENEIIGEMLNHRDVYFDKVNLAWTEFDPSQAFINRGLFPFDYDFKWEKEIEPSQYVPLIKDFFQNPDKSISEKGNVNHKDFKTEKYIYNYYWIDLGQRAQKGELIWDDKVQKYELTDNWQGRDLDMDAKALPHYKSGVRRHSDLGRFHAEELLSIYPGVNCSSCNHICTHEHGENLTDAELLKACGKCSENWSVDIQPYDFWSEPEALVHGLTYAQAMAFYNWKYHSHTWWEKSDTRFYDDLVPTEEQFIRIQKGESITIEKQKLQFPDPWFRYVIHFYTK